MDYSNLLQVLLARHQQPQGGAAMAPMGQDAKIAGAQQAGLQGLQNMFAHMQRQPQQGAPLGQMTLPNDTPKMGTGLPANPMRAAYAQGAQIGQAQPAGGNAGLEAGQAVQGMSPAGHALLQRLLARRAGAQIPEPNEPQV